LVPADADFEISPPVTAGTVLAPGEVLPLTIIFTPKAGGAQSATLVISNSGLEPDVKLALSGTGQSPDADIQVAIPNNNAGGQKLGGAPKALDDFATLRNAGSQPLTITAIAPDDASIGQFTPTGLPAGFGPARPLVLQPGDSFPLGLAFSPKLVGLQRGQLRISSDDPEQPTLTLPVIGTGLPATGSALDYGHDFVALEEPLNPAAPVLRQVSDGQGNWSFF